MGREGARAHLRLRPEGVLGPGSQPVVFDTKAGAVWSRGSRASILRALGLLRGQAPGGLWTAGPQEQGIQGVGAALRAAGHALPGSPASTVERLRRNQPAGFPFGKG